MNKILFFPILLITALSCFAQNHPLLPSENSSRPFYNLSKADDKLTTSQLVNSFNARSKGNDSLMLLDSVHIYFPNGAEKFHWYAYKYNSKGKITEYFEYGSMFKTLYKLKYDYLANDSLNYAIFYKQKIQTYPAMNTIVTPLEVDQYTYDSTGYLTNIHTRNYYPSTPIRTVNFYYDTNYNNIKRHGKEYLYGTWSDSYLYEHFYNAINLDTAMHFYDVLPDSTNLSLYALVYSDYDSLNREIEVSSLLSSQNGLYPFRRFYLEYDSFGNNSYLSLYEYQTDVNQVVADTFYNNFSYNFRGLNAIDSMHKVVGLKSNINPIRRYYERYFYTKQSLLPDSMHRWIKEASVTDYDLIKRFVYSYDSLSNLISEIEYTPPGNIQKQTCYYYNWHHPLGISTIAGKNAIKHRVYPNPALDVITLKLDNSPAKNTILQVYSTDGRKAMDDILLNSKMHELDVSRLIPGIYLYRIISPASDAVGGKFIKY